MTRVGLEYVVETSHQTPVGSEDEYETGPLLITGLGQEATPLFRYRIGDVGTRSKKPCACGRSGDVFLEVDGRVEDYVLTPDGRMRRATSRAIHRRSIWWRARS